jgi:hypothetical protein
MDMREVLARIVASDGGPLEISDGGLLEIYVFGTDVDDWRRVLDRLARSGYVHSLTKEDVPIGVEDWDPLFNEDHDTPYRLELSVGGQAWTTGFYSEEFIDFQCGRSDVQDVDDIFAILSLMRLLHAATERHVVLIPETVRPEEVKPYLEIRAGGTVADG